jgi:heme/copper-type cytochrome/quinol oxidase subunit 1
VQHFHYTLGGGSLFALFAALFFYFPKIFGVKLDERLGNWFTALFFTGFNLTFIPMGFAGLEGMARRVSTYPDAGHLALLNGLSSLGTLVIAISVAVFFANVLVSVLRREPVGNDPWGGYSLEWLTSSPPPEFNFHELPPIRSKLPAWDPAEARETLRL